MTTSEKRIEEWKHLRIVMLLFFSILTYISSFAQLREKYVGTDKNTDINGMSFISPSTGFVAFTNYIGYTTDSGKTFVQRPITYNNTNYNNQSINLTFGFYAQGVKAFSTDSLFAYGHYGTEPSILFSSNGGLTWNLVFHQELNPYASVFNEGITDMVFPDNGSSGVAIHHEQIIHTDNRGQSWYATLNASGKQLRKLSFPTATTGYAIGYGKLYRTTDGGSFWGDILLPSTGTDDVDFNNVCFLTEKTGYISDSKSRRIYRTADGGNTWQQMNDETLYPTSGSDMHFVNDSTGYITAFYSYDVYKTTDYGKTWERCKKSTSYQYLYYGLNALFFYNDNIAWFGGKASYLMITTDGARAIIPASVFTADTTGVANTGNVTLTNHSKTGYQYQWYKNGTLISSDFNTTYSHDLYQGADTIQLIVSNGSDKDTSSQVLYFNVPPPPPTVPSYSGWTSIPTGITDNLHDVRMYGSNGIVIGDKGIYTTTNGDGNSPVWTKFSTASATDNQLVKQVKFLQVTCSDHDAIFYLCGNDTVNHKGIILKIQLPDLSYTFIYQGDANTKLNAIASISVESYLPPYLLAVGDKGLTVCYIPNTNSLNASYLSDGKNLIDVFPRQFYSRIDKTVGVLAQDEYYTGFLNSSNFEINNSNPLPFKAIGGINGGTYTDFIASDKRLYFVVSFDPSITIDSSITKEKPATLRYNSAASAVYPLQGFMATDSGIYLANISASEVNGTETIEYQPTSNHLQINRIRFKNYPAFDTGYAVGNNGILLKTVNRGGPTVPYGEILTTGNCLGEATLLQSYHGTASNCSWSVDGGQPITGCSSQYITINTAGDHTLQYIASNNYGLADTSYKIITISNPPVTSLSVSVNDSVLCKSEPVIVTINNTQQGYIYEVIQDSTGTSFGSGAGNGGQIHITTSPVSVSGNYNIRVSGINGGCVRNLTTILHLIAEHTRSAITATKINATVNEPVAFYNHSSEASTFKWVFHEDANTGTSSLPDPTNIFYKSTGQKTVSLICTSANGCSDTLLSNAVLVYNKPVPDDNCYTENIADTNIYGLGASYHSLALAKDNGYIITGTGNKPTIKSRYGSNKDLTENLKTYIAKYTTDGALQWTAYSTSGGNINACVTDDQGNIYITGESAPTTYLVLNSGDSLWIGGINDSDLIFHPAVNNGFVIKLDSTGRLIWHNTIHNVENTNIGYAEYFSPNKMSFRNGRIIIGGFCYSRLDYVRNGVSQTMFSMPQPANDFDNNAQNNFLLSIKDDGSLEWSTYFHNQATNIYKLSDIAFDGSGNCYATGVYEEKLIINDTKGKQVTLNGENSHFYSYVAKFDKQGVFQWTSQLENPFSFDRIQTEAMAVDNNGNSYVTGYNSILDGNSYFTVTSSDGTTNHVSTSGYFLTKFNAQGKFGWSVGSQYAYYGGGTAVYLNGNSVYAAGNAYLNGQSPAVFGMTSSSGITTNINLSESEYFVAQYDTAGVLKRLTQSGANAGGHIVLHRILSDAKNNFIMGGQVDENNGGVNHFTLFNHSLDVYDQNPFIVKTDYNFCGAPIIYPDSSCKIVQPDFLFYADQIKDYTIDFTDLTAHYNDSLYHNNISWYFGDGDSSVEKQPSHTYKDSGTYMVTMRYTSSSGCYKDTTKQVVVKLPVCYLYARWSVTGNTVTGIPLQFTNATNPDNNVTYKWDFGNGDTSNQTIPVYAYTTAGTYKVRLTATSSAICSSYYDSVLVIYDKPAACTVTAGFTSSGTLVTPAVVQFTSTSVNAKSYKWNFGNNNTSDAENPVYVYSEAGTYNIQLIASDAFCNDTIRHTITIVKRPDSCTLKAGFTYQTDTLTNTVSFSNFSSPADSVNISQWSFGDGTTATDKNPVHVYAKGGTYIVCLSISFDSGCHNEHCDTINIAEQLSGSVEVYPNPATSVLHTVLTVYSANNVTVCVYNSFGVLVNQQTKQCLPGSNTIDTPVVGLTPGEYYMKIALSDGTYFLKSFIKM